METVIVLLSKVSEKESWRKQVGDIIQFFPAGHIFGTKEVESYFPVMVESSKSIADLNKEYTGYVDDPGVKNRYYIPLSSVVENRVYTEAEFLSFVQDKFA